MGKKKVTSTDIARAAGVSQSTVSMVLNKKYTVTFETRCEKQMENSAGRTFKLDITVRK